MEVPNYQFSESIPHPAETKATQESPLDFRVRIGNPPTATADCDQGSSTYAPVLYPISPAVVYDENPIWSPRWNAISHPSPLTTPPQAHSTPVSTRLENHQLPHMARNPTSYSQKNAVPEMHMNTLSELKDKAAKFQSFIANNSTMRQICNDMKQKRIPKNTAKKEQLPSIGTFSTPRIPTSSSLLVIPFMQYSYRLASDLMQDEVDSGYYSYINDSAKKDNENQNGSYHGMSDFLFSECNTSKREEQSDFVDKILDSIDEDNSRSCLPSYPVTNIKQEQDSSSSTCMYVCDAAPSITQSRKPLSMIQSRETTCVESLVQTPSPVLGRFGSTNRVNFTNFLLEDPVPCYEQFAPVAYSCPVCQAPLSTKSALREHVLTHKDYRPYQCIFCSKRFRQRSTLAVHTRIHTGDRPYKCEHCARAFADCSTYKKHARTHTGEKPYECCVCKKKFGQSGNMIRHLKTHFKTLQNITANSVKMQRICSS